jgi:hypothetical protein
VVTVAKADGPLPGSAQEQFVRIPTFAMLALAPIMGALLVMFLPFIGFVLVGREVVQRAAGHAKALTRRRGFVVHGRAARKMAPAADQTMRKAS